MSDIPQIHPGNPRPCLNQPFAQGSFWASHPHMGPEYSFHGFSFWIQTLPLKPKVTLSYIIPLAVAHGPTIYTSDCSSNQLWMPILTLNPPYTNPDRRPLKEPMALLSILPLTAVTIICCSFLLFVILCYPYGWLSVFGSLI